MKIVMLDRNSIGLDIDVSFFEELGDFEYHDTADMETSKDYIKDADIVIMDGCLFETRSKVVATYIDGKKVA